MTSCRTKRGLPAGPFLEKRAWAPLVGLNDFDEVVPRAAPDLKRRRTDEVAAGHEEKRKQERQERRATEDGHEKRQWRGLQAHHGSAWPGGAEREEKQGEKEKEIGGEKSPVASQAFQNLLIWMREAGALVISFI